MSTRIPDAELISRLRTIAASFEGCQMPTAAQTLTLAADRIKAHASCIAGPITRHRSAKVAKSIKGHSFERVVVEPPGGWFEKYQCGCQGKLVRHKKDLPGRCPIHFDPPQKITRLAADRIAALGKVRRNTDNISVAKRMKK